MGAGTAAIARVATRQARGAAGGFLRALVVLAALCGAAPAQAVPTIRDHWHFFCGGGKANSKLMVKMHNVAGSGGVKGAIAALNYACLMELNENDTFKKRYAKWQEDGSKPPEPKPDNRSSAAQLRQAVASLGAAYKSAKKNPKVLFYYAYALSLVGDEYAVNRFDDLMTGFGGSPLLPDAHLALGEYYFERRDMPKAFREYNTALKTGKALTVGYTRYKMAWINFAMGIDAKDPGKQRKAIEDLVELSEKLGESSVRKLQALSEIIDDDVIDLLVQQGNLDEAKRILTKLNADDVYAGVLERIGYNKLAAGDGRSAYSLFAMSLKEGPTRAEALQMHATVVGLAAQMNDAKRVVDNLKLMVNNYVRPKSAWRKENKGPIGQRAETQVEGLVFDFATGLDRQGREQNNASFVDGARELYLLYQKAFPKSKRLYDIKTLYGEVLFAQKQFLPAARYILALIKKEPRGKATKELSEVMVTAAQSAIDADKTKYTLPEPGTALAELTIPPIKQTYAECLDLFVKLQPSNPQAGAMIFAAGGVFFDFGHYDEAIKHYYEYLRRFPNGDFIKNAAYSIMLYYTKDQDGKKLKEAKQRIGANPALRQAPELQVFFQAPDLPANDSDGDGDSVAASSPKGKGKAKGKSKGKGKKGKKPAPSGDGGDDFGDDDDDGSGGGGGKGGAETTDADFDADFGD